MILLKRMGFFIGSVVAVMTAAVAAVATNPRSSSVQSDVKMSSRVAAPIGALSRRAMGATRMRAGTSPRAVSQTRRAISAGGTRVVESGHADSARTSVARSGTIQKTNSRTGARSATNTVAGLSRAATTARATAVFNDLSKIGSGYAGCRESYATCMDQMCANANDTYRRCFCSDRFTKFRNIEESLDQAMVMLQQFQDNNLEAVDKTAEEVNAMYSASIGEAAIKRDTSASAKMLDNINKLLSGQTSSVAQTNTNSIGILDLDFSTDFDDIWSDGGSSLFDTGSQDLSTLEGTALFNAAQRQCSRITQDSCENNAVFTMSRSSYNILISQDCNAYEKSLNKKKETVAQAIRTAEKYLREARLEEYRAHNSTDVNECLGRVRTAMLADTACGESYKRCLDPTGAYISPATGEPIYSSRLFQLEKTISLPGVTNDSVNTDILGANDTYNKFLDGYRMYVTQQLDTCRSIADFVWTEFKRNAIIEIAQAQTNKIEEVKASCVDTIAECYDTQTQSIVNLGTEKTAKTAGALGRYTARDMCTEKVTACAALYGNNQSCKFDERGHLTSDAASCGLTSLIKYVETVDNLTVMEKCKDALDNYLVELCTPDDEKYEYPYKCKGMKASGTDDPMSLEYAVTNFVNNYCSNPTGDSKASEDAQMSTYIKSAIGDVVTGVRSVLAGICESKDGYWYDVPQSSEVPLTVFYNDVWGRGNSNTETNEWGGCYEQSNRIVCNDYNTGLEEDNYMTEWDATHEQCVFKDAWYKVKCEELGGYYENNTCYTI